MVLGFTVAWAARLQIKRGARLFREVYLPALLVLVALLHFPISLYLLSLHPRIATAALAGRETEAMAAGVVMAGSLVTAMLSYLAGYHLCKRRAAWLSMVLGIACAGALLILGASFWPRALGEDGKLPTDLVMVSAVAVPVILAGWLFVVLLIDSEGRKIGRVRLGTTAPAIPARPIVTIEEKASDSFQEQQQVVESQADKPAQAVYENENSPTKQSPLPGPAEAKEKQG
ncbi:MAG: hypothetical protein D6806_03785 [Deltaproteobacteria bacterium]|nr:MAG: hypothetical protein D6806_03785 [Deltaproteobacteria bacterium]